MAGQVRFMMISISVVRIHCSEKNTLTVHGINEGDDTTGELESL